LDQIDVERSAVDDLSGATGGLDGDIEHRVHKTDSFYRGVASAATGGPNRPECAGIPSTKAN
jgi:hypothetical protein